MKINVLSDIHTEYYGQKTCHAMLQMMAKEMQGNVLILAGDIGRVDTPKHYFNLYRTFDIFSRRFDHVFFICGNHEFYSTSPLLTMAILQKRLRLLTARFKNVSFLDRHAVAYNGITFIGCTLWSRAEPQVEKFLSDFKKIYTAPHTQMTLATYRNLFERDYQWLKRTMAQVPSDLVENDAVIVITHHGTHEKLNGHFFHEDNPNVSGFCTHLPELWTGKQVTWINGHTHLCCKIEQDSATFISNCWGYPDERWCDKSKLLRLLLQRP